MIKNCPVCKKKKFKKIFSTNTSSIYNLSYFNTLRRALKSPVTKVSFVECCNCNFLFNQIYRQLNYKVNYDANRNFSNTFNIYLNSVLKFLEQNIPSPKNEINTILEVGFGDGEFLKKILNSKKFKKKRIFGYDPSFNKKKLTNFILSNTYLSKKYYDKKIKINPDLIILRHTLEHISNIKSFLRKILHESPKYLFIEIPCKDFVYKGNFHYFSNEHCSYFSSYSLQLLLKNFKYKKIKLTKSFNSENILAIFMKTEKEILINKSLNKNNLNFNFRSFKKNFYKRFNLQKDFIWGASGKGVGFVNLLKINYKNYKYIIDINESIQGKYISVSGIKIISPTTLKNFIDEKSKIFISNPLYKNEIIKILKKIKIKTKINNLINI